MNPCIYCAKLTESKLCKTCEHLLDACYKTRSVDVSSPRFAVARKCRDVVAAHFGLTVEQMASAIRDQAHAWPRHIAIYLARTIGPELTLSEIGAVFGGRDHSTIMHALKRVQNEIRLKDEVLALVTRLEAEVMLD